MGREDNMKLNLKGEVFELGTTHTTLRGKMLEIFAFPRQFLQDRNI